MSSGGPPIVLVVDDTDEILDGVRVLLEFSGYRVVTAHDGARALQTIASCRGSERPDLILLDLMMPGMDGHGFWSALRANPDLAGIPVVVSSATSEEDAIPGTDGVLKKPFEERELLKVVERFCRPISTCLENSLKT